ncbi:transporter associated domain-containing protein [Limimaricola hongkongensis]|uniref:Magnesium and cobalt efflux protein CorC n=1 Tax=Limimaricola hongkongensis DSM 17492 TaxID=1122180 RepID=A0A017H8H7_9RHOB|nr:hemolysin family protein [Limimaricola hongkongensis]EYD70812.1 Magnesium and cobalt efflux protein CorC [Limimaricola hongkongensis DSM 17492]
MGDAFDTAAAGSPRDADGDGPEGSSSATAENGGGRGFFSRIIGVLNPAESDLPAVEVPRGFAPVLPMPGMLNLRRMRVEDVMVPKADITAVPVSIPMDELIEVFRDSGLTRIPVFDGTLDTPIGLVNLKDFALRYCFVPERPDFSLRDMLRSLLYVPPSMPLGVLLQKMQTERIHMALVIDEYGGTDGLVTIEDLIETVVGEIEDEHDVDEAQSFLREKPGVWLALARTPLETFERAIGMDLTDHEEIDEEEIDSLGGLVSMLAGHVPARGEVIEHPAGIEFEVIDADPRRIKRLRIRLPESRDV